MGDKCKRCGLSINQGTYLHKEEKCDFVPIDWTSMDEVAKLTYVEDIDIMVEPGRKMGYGIWEIVKIYDIMKRLWREAGRSPFASHYRIFNDRWSSGNQNLYNEAKKVYEKKD